MTEQQRNDGVAGAVAPAIPLAPADAAPSSLLDGISATICEALAIKGLGHRSALLELGRRARLPSGSVAAAYRAIADNWRRCHAAGNGRTSTTNWRWRASRSWRSRPHNRGAEVVLERALVAACERLGRADWSNQVPVASGIARSASERRRAIDLVHEHGAGHFELIELKVASDTPLYAAFEIIGYTCIWLLSRERASANPLLAANRIDAVVLAPPVYYQRYDLADVRAMLDAELRDLGRSHGVELSFRFEVLPDPPGEPPHTDKQLIARFDERRSL